MKSKSTEERLVRTILKMCKKKPTVVPFWILRFFTCFRTFRTQKKLRIGKGWVWIRLSSKKTLRVKFTSMIFKVKAKFSTFNLRFQLSHWKTEKWRWSKYWTFQIPSCTGKKRTTQNSCLSLMPLFLTSFEIL